MTMSFSDVKAELDRLDGLPFPPDSYRLHYEALRHLTVEALQAAVSLAQRECARYPTPAEILACSDRAAPRVTGLDLLDAEPLETPVVLELPVRGMEGTAVAHVTVTHKARYGCPVCRDTGWRSWACGDAAQRIPWLDAQHCGQDRPHAGHEWVEPCPCRPSNLAYTRTRQRIAQQAAVRAEKPAR